MTYTRQSHSLAVFNENKEDFHKTEMPESPDWENNDWDSMIVILNNLYKLGTLMDSLVPETIKNSKLLLNLSDSLNKLHVELKNIENLSNVYSIYNESNAKKKGEKK